MVLNHLSQTRKLLLEQVGLVVLTEYNLPLVSIITSSGDGEVIFVGLSSWDASKQCCQFAFTVYWEMGWLLKSKN